MSKTRTNKILVLFIFLMVAFFTILSSFLQSHYFGSIASEQVSKYVKSKFNTEIEFSKLSVSLFPMATTLEGIKVEKKEFGIFSFKEIELSISPFDVFKSDLKISQVKIADGFIEVFNKEDKDSKKEFDIKEYKKINEIISKNLKSLPVTIGSVVLNDVDIISERHKVSVDYLKVNLNETLDFAFDIKNFKQEAISLDQINVEGRIKNNVVELKKIKLYKNRTKVMASGKIQIKNDFAYKIKLNYSGEIFEFYQMPKLNISGLCDCNFEISGEGLSYKVISDGRVRNLLNNVYSLDMATFNFTLDNKELSIGSLKGERGSAHFDLREKLQFDLKSKKISTINLALSKFDFSTIVNNIGTSNILEGDTTGNIKINYNISDNSFSTKGALKFENIKVGSGDKILDLKTLNFVDLVVEKKESISISANGKIGESKLFLAGNLFEKEIDLSLKIDNFELSELGGSVGSFIKGRGEMDASFKGAYNDLELQLIANNVKGLSILDYNLHYNSNVAMTYQFKDNVILISRINSENILEVENGFVDLNKQTLDLGIKYRDLQLKNLTSHLAPLKQSLAPIVDKLSGEVTGRTRMSGKFSNIIIKSEIVSKKFAIASEAVTSLRADFTIDAKKIVVKDLQIRRGEGVLSAQAEFDFSKGLVSISSNAQGIRLTDFLFYRNLGLGYDAEINYQFKIENTTTGYSGAGIARFLSSNVGRKRIKPSSISFDILNSELLLKGSLLGTRVNFDSRVYLDPKATKKSNLKVFVDIEDIRLLLGMMSLHNVYDADLIGYVRGKLDASFDIKKIEDLDLSVAIEKFFVKKSDKEIELAESSSNRIVINNSEIEALDISLKGSGGEYHLKGLGNLRQKAKLEQAFSLDLSFLQILTSKIVRASGRMSGSGIFFGSFKEFDDSHSIRLENVMVIHQDTPLILSDLNMKSILTSKKWEITSLEGKVGSGKVTGKGKIDFIRPVPRLNLGLKLENISYPIADNSRILFDAYIDLVGSSLPYSMRGSVAVNGGSVNDEFTAFTGGTGVKKSVDKYIAVRQQGLPEIISLNIDVKTHEKILVKNRIADAILNANAKITESPLSPDIKAKVSLVPQLSKFRFKGTEFIVSEGLVNYDSTNTLNTLFVNLTAMAKISTYDIKMEVIGSDDDLKVNMESNPTLSKEDIFSLLALGVTSDFAKNLEDKDRTSLTTIGLGTLIVDQLKINEGLDSTLGLKLSVLPEIGDNDSTPIQNSKNEALSKNKTATKLRIQKKVSNNVGLTFANTFGSSEGQKQEMNIDYNINKKWSVQGVFESDTGVDAGENNSNSVGADIKYRWDF